MSQWIEWQGGECPVKELVAVEAKTRNGLYQYTGNPKMLDWGHSRIESRGYPYDIIAYRIIKEAE